MEAYGRALQTGVVTYLWQFACSPSGASGGVYILVHSRQGENSLKLQPKTY